MIIRKLISAAVFLLISSSVFSFSYEDDFLIIQGDYNGDSKLDFIMVSGFSAGNPYPEYVLQQNNSSNTFKIIPNPNPANLGQNWYFSNAEINIDDYNADGVMDIMLDLNQVSAIQQAWSSSLEQLIIYDYNQPPRSTIRCEY